MNMYYQHQRIKIKSNVIPIRLKHVLMIAFLFFSISLSATIIDGTVVDARTGELLVGATVIVKGSTQSVIAGLDGSFKLKSNVNQCTIVCSYLGYKTKEINVEGESKSIVIKLEGNSTELKDVEVVARNDKTTEISAIKSEQLSNNVLNVVGARTIELSPDVTVAGVVQRISGVTIERSNTGDGEYAVLRGMNKRYNYTLVNGIKISSPNDKDRYISLDIFPSELLDRLEVTKSLTPEMEGDAIGGVVNLVMKDAPSSLRFTFNLSTGYNSLFFNRKFQSYDTGNILQKSPYEEYGNGFRARFKDFPTSTVDLKNKNALPNLSSGFSIGNSFLNNKLGVILAGSFQHTYSGNNSLYFTPATATSDASNLPVLQDERNRNYSELKTRFGLHGKIDFELAPLNKIQLYTAYMNTTSDQVRDERIINLSYGYDPSAGDYNVSYTTRFKQNHQTIFSSDLHGDHSFFNRFLNINWDIVYSKATNKTPDNTTVTTGSTVTSNKEGVVAAEGEDIRWEHNSDNEKSGYLNTKFALTKDLNLSLGGVYRDKRRNNFFDDYTLDPYNSSTGSNNLIKGTDWNNYTQITYSVYNPSGSTGDPLNYKASEKVGAGYTELKYEEGAWSVIAGVRLEHTNQGYNLLYSTSGVQNVGSQKYNDWLPSLHIKYSPWKNQNFKTSYYRSINRPSFFEIVPYNIVNEDYTEKGNPDLKHTTADNLDFRYEIFPKPSEQFMCGVFYKKIQNPIEYGMTTTGQSTFYMPENFGSATNYGVELDATKYFNSFGVRANYTYTKSSITTNKFLNYSDGTSIKTKNVDQTRPLYGQAPSIANLALLYKDNKLGLDAQLMGVYTGKRLYTVSHYYNNDLWENDDFRMDVSIEKKWLGNRLTTFFKATNILNTTMTVYLKEKNSANNDITDIKYCNGGTLTQKNRYGAQFQLGLRLKLE
jgi:TonB-dependent receptor